MRMNSRCSEKKKGNMKAMVEDSIQTTDFKLGNVYAAKIFEEFAAWSAPRHDDEIMMLPVWLQVIIK